MLYDFFLTRICNEARLFLWKWHCFLEQFNKILTNYEECDKNPSVKKDYRKCLLGVQVAIMATFIWCLHSLQKDFETFQWNHWKNFVSMLFALMAQALLWRELLHCASHKGVRLSLLLEIWHTIPFSINNSWASEAYRSNGKSVDARSVEEFSCNKCSAYSTVSRWVYSIQENFKFNLLWCYNYPFVE